jgi:hypothetical protein
MDGMQEEMAPARREGDLPARGNGAGNASFRLYDELYRRAAALLADRDLRCAPCPDAAGCAGIGSCAPLRRWKNAYVRVRRAMAILEWRLARVDRRPLRGRGHDPAGIFTMV